MIQIMSQKWSVWWRYCKVIIENDQMKRNDWKEGFASEVLFKKEQETRWLFLEKQKKKKKKKKKEKGKKI